MISAVVLTCENDSTSRTATGRNPSHNGCKRLLQRLALASATVSRISRLQQPGTVLHCPRHPPWAVRWAVVISHLYQKAPPLSEPAFCTWNCPFSSYELRCHVERKVRNLVSAGVAS